MKVVASTIVFSASASALADKASPIEKTIQLLADLEAKVIKEGEAVQKEYEEYSEWCEDRSRDLGFEIKTGTAAKEELSATIAKEATVTEELSTKIESLAADITTDEADLKAATEIREKEEADFSEEEKELSETVDMLERAIAVIEKEMNGGASMMQLKSATNLQDALAVMVKASVMSTADEKRLTDLVQTSQTSDDSDSDSDTGAPDAAAYESHSTGILDTLNGLLEKGQEQLSAARGTETNNKNNFDMLAQSLHDEIAYANKDKNAATKALATSGEIKATAEGDLAVTSKDLAEDQKSLSTTHQDCMTKAEDFEAATSARAEELKALGEAKKAVKDMASGAGDLSYSMLQVDSYSYISSGAALANFEAVRFVRDLARKQNSPALAQLASRLDTALRLGAGAGGDPFGKIKGLITDMIAKLEKEADDAADLKGWCDKEIAESKAKKEDATAENEKLTTKIDSAIANSKKLKEEVATLQKELSDLAQSQGEMDKLRAEEKALYDVNKPELDLGLKGVKLALKILNEYFSKSGKSSSSGAGSGIIGMLEVVESDFSKNLAEVVATEEAAAATYDRETKENDIEKATKDKDVEYKTKEHTGLDKAVTELTTDREGVQTELDATLEYLKSLDKKCVYKVETYAERAARREAEVAGLKEALSIMETEAAFIQKSSGRKSLRLRRHQ